MRMKIAAGVFARRRLERDMRRHAKPILGRLRRHIAQAELALKEEDAGPVGGVHVCTLRLRLHDSARVFVLARGAGKAVALTNALRLARQALFRRGAARRLRSPAWRSPVQPAPA